MNVGYLLMNSIHFCSIASCRWLRESKKANAGNGVSILVSIPVSYSEMRHVKLLSDFLVDIRFLRNWQPGKSWSQLLGSWFKLGISLYVVSLRLKEHDNSSKLLPHPDLLHWFSSRLFFLPFWSCIDYNLPGSLLSNQLPIIKSSQSSFIYWKLTIGCNNKDFSSIEEGRKPLLLLSKFRKYITRHKFLIARQVIKCLPVFLSLDVIWVLFACKLRFNSKWKHYSQVYGIED